MKICAIICEYNPFHNGHKYLIKRARELSGCDAVLCIMSASFTQRGEAAVLGKFERAVHAVRGGAACVVQLPAAFSIAPAELFAQGAISILKSIPAVTCLAFGCENANSSDIWRACDIITSGGDESPLRRSITDKMKGGESYKRSLADALGALGADGTLVSSPNGILALEYARAIKASGADIEILPVQRMGAGYGDGQLKDNFSSASAIRANLENAKVAGNVPDYVFDAIKKVNFNGVNDRADALLRYALCSAEKSDITRIFGCTEGLENKLKNCIELPAEEIIAEATSKRYTSSRIRRILTANMLGIYSDDVNRHIAEGTYIKPLAVREEIKDEIFAELSRSSLPVIIKKMSLKALSPSGAARYAMPESAAHKCYQTDMKADFVRALIYGEQPQYDYTVKIVK